MRIQFLGTGGFHPTERRHTAGVLLPDIGVAFDAGTSAFRIAPRLQTESLQLFISHAHLDHICGLTYLLVPLMLQSIRSCQVYADEVYLDAIRQHLFAAPIFPVLPQLEFHCLGEVTKVNGGEVRWFPLHHPGGACGFRLNRDDGKSLAYFCDTNANDDCLEFLSGVDVLIHECSFPDSLSQWCEKTGHSHTSQVAHLARKANVGRLYLTHVDPTLTDEDPLGVVPARTIFPEIQLADDLLTIEL